MHVLTEWVLGLPDARLVHRLFDLGPLFGHGSQDVRWHQHPAGLGGKVISQAPGLAFNARRLWRRHADEGSG